MLFRENLFLKMIERHHSPSDWGRESRTFFVYLQSGRGLENHSVNPVQKKRAAD